MKIVSYNINGIRASMRAGLKDYIERQDADILCFQEVRCDEALTKEILFGSEQTNMFFAAENFMDRYHATYNCGEVKGYSGTLILSKTKPDKVFRDMGEFWKDNEGRTTTIVIGKTAVVNAYIPNGNSRLDFKLDYFEALTRYVTHLKETYSVILVGDFNIAHNEIDLTNPKECSNKSVFLPVERRALGKLLSCGFIDAFRFLHPNERKYSWRSYRTASGGGGMNGWMYRMDYVIVSKDLESKLTSCDIEDVNYSDHLPVVAEIEL